MLKYRKIPVVVEAEQLTVDNLEKTEAWSGGAIKGVKLDREYRVLDIQTLNGEVRVEIGEWVIKGVEGEFYPCANSIFHKTYELCS